jgi:hypothetical protein
LLIVVQLWPVCAAAAQLIAAVLHDPQVAIVRVDGDRDRVADSARKVLTLGLRLIQLPCVEAPDSGARFELRTRIDTGGLELPIVTLAGVRPGANVDVERAVGGDRERLGGMSLRREPLHHHFRFARGRQRPGGKPIAKDVGRVLDVEKAVEESDLAAMKVAKLAALVGDTIAVSIPETDDAPTLEGDEHITVRRDRQMTGLGEAVGEDRGAKALRQRNAPVVRGTSRASRCLGCRTRRRYDAGEQSKGNTAH